MIEDAADLAELFDPELGAESAIYEPASGTAAFRLELFFSAPGESLFLGRLGIVAEVPSALVQAADVAAPAVGDRITVRGASYQVSKIERESSGLAFALSLKAA